MRTSSFSATPQAAALLAQVVAPDLQHRLQGDQADQLAAGHPHAELGGQALRLLEHAVQRA